MKSFNLWLACLIILCIACDDSKKVKKEDLPAMWGQCLKIKDMRGSSLVRDFISETPYYPLVNWKVPNTSSKNIGTTKQTLNIVSSTLWDIKKIPVCWEDADPNNKWQKQRDLVRSAVERTWNSALKGFGLPDDQVLEFVGWGFCEGNNGGIRIKISDENPYCQRVGKNLKDVPSGMVLNFSFINWSPDCNRAPYFYLTCIDFIAVHEFGHALGLTHEHNRIDTPQTCKQAPSGDDGDV